MAGTDQNREVFKKIDMSLIEMMGPDDKAKLAKIISDQLAIQVSVHEVYTILMNIINSDITDFLEDDGEGGYKLIANIKDLPLAKRQQLKEIQIDRTDYKDKDGKTNRTNYKYKLKLHDKVKVLEHVQRYLDMWGDNRRGRGGSDRINQFFSEVDSAISDANKKGIITDVEPA